jgi:hypothetical protein
MSSEFSSSESLLRFSFVFTVTTFRLPLRAGGRTLGGIPFATVRVIRGIRKINYLSCISVLPKYMFVWWQDAPTSHITGFNRSQPVFIRSTYN